MTKYKLLSILRNHGDVLLYIDKEWICTTVDFSIKYIKKKSKRKYNTNGGVLVFSWSHDKFLVIDPTKVIKVEPLSKILNNAKQEKR